MRTLDELRLGSRGPAVPVVVHQAGPGPAVAITANVHGDEVVGVAAAHGVDRWLRAALRAGTVVIYPTVNPSGLESGARQFAQQDLNRAFPGSPRGTAAQRAAQSLFADLEARRPDAAIDLHSDSPAAVPYALVDRAVHLSGAARSALEARSEALARASGLLWLREYPDDEYMRYQLDRSLAGAVLNRLRIPSVTLEVGPRRIAAPAAVGRMVAAVRGILAHLGLVDGDADPAPADGPLRRASAPRAERAGLFVPSLGEGEAFVAGDPIGEVRATSGAVLSVIRAPAAGRVISWAEGAWVDAGAGVGTLALEDR